MDVFTYVGNSIGSEGAQALAECLKQNTTLTYLDINCTSEFRGFMFASAWFDPADNLWMFALILFVLRQQHWLRGSAGSGRVSEAEHDPHPA